MRETLAGIYPPVPTPFGSDGEIDTAALTSNLTRWVNESELAGFLILGSNGEAVYLDEDEKLRLFEAARAAIPQDRLFIAGTGAESTRATIRLTKQAAELGADVAIVVTPYYYKPAMTADAMAAHFFAVADASPIPVLVYNVPAYTSLDLPSDTLIRLGQHPNIIGMKESGGNVVKMGEICRAFAASGKRFEVLAGSASFLLPALSVGAVGGVLATANIAPDSCVKLWKAFKAGEMAEAQKIQHSLLPVNAAVTSQYGVAGLKYVMDKRGYYGGPVRPPLQPLSAAGQKAIQEIVDTGF